MLICAKKYKSSQSFKKLWRKNVAASLIGTPITSMSRGDARFLCNIRLLSDSLSLCRVCMLSACVVGILLSTRKIRNTVFLVGSVAV